MSRIDDKKIQEFDANPLIPSQIKAIKEYVEAKEGLLGKGGHNKHNSYRIAQAAVSLSYAGGEFTNSEKNILFQAIATTFDDNTGWFGQSYLRGVLQRGQAQQLKNDVPSGYEELKENIENHLQRKLDPTYRTLLKILLATLKSNIPADKMPLAIDQWVSTYFLFRNESTLYLPKDTKDIKDRVNTFKGSYNHNSTLDDFVTGMVDHKSKRYQKNKEKWIAGIIALQKSLNEIKKEFTESKIATSEPKEQKEPKKYSAALNLLEPTVLRTLKEQNSVLDSFFESKGEVKNQNLSRELTGWEFKQSLVAGLKPGELDQELKDIEEKINEIKDLTHRSLSLEKKGDYLLKKYESLKKFALQQPSDLPHSEIRNERLNKVRIAADKVIRLMRTESTGFESVRLQTLVESTEKAYDQVDKLHPYYDSVLDKVAAVDDGFKEIKRIRTSIDEVKDLSSKTALNSLSDCISIELQEQNEHLKELYSFQDETEISKIEEVIEAEINETKKLVADIEQLEKRGQELIRYLDELDRKGKKLQGDQIYLSSPSSRQKVIEDVKTSTREIRTQILTFKPQRSQDDIFDHLKTVSQFYDKCQQQINENNKKLLKEECTDPENFAFLSHKNTVVSMVSKTLASISKLVNSMASNLSASFFGSFISSSTEVKQINNNESYYSGLFQELKLNDKYPHAKNDISNSLKVEIKLEEIKGISDPLKLVLIKHQFSSWGRHLFKDSEANVYKAASCFCVRQALNELKLLRSGENPNPEVIKIVINNIELILNQMESNAIAINESSENFKLLIKDFRNELSNEKANIFRKLGIESHVILGIDPHKKMDNAQVEKEVQAFEISSIVTSFPRKTEENTSEWLRPIYSQEFSLNSKLRGPLAIVAVNSTETKELASFYGNHANHVFKCVLKEIDELSDKINLATGSEGNLKDLNTLESLSNYIENFLILNKNLDLLIKHISSKKSNFFDSDAFLKGYEKEISYYKNLSNSAEKLKKLIDETQSAVVNKEKDMVESQLRILSTNPERAGDIVESVENENPKLASKLKQVVSDPSLTTQFDKRIEAELLMPISSENGPEPSKSEYSSISIIPETKSSLRSTPQSDSKVSVSEVLTPVEEEKLANAEINSLLTSIQDQIKIFEERFEELKMTTGEDINQILVLSEIKLGSIVTDDKGLTLSSWIDNAKLLQGQSPPTVEIKFSGLDQKEETQVIPEAQFIGYVSYYFDSLSVKIQSKLAEYQSLFTTLIAQLPDIDEKNVTTWESHRKNLLELIDQYDSVITKLEELQFHLRLTNCEDLVIKLRQNWGNLLNITKKNITKDERSFEDFRGEIDVITATMKDKFGELAEVNLDRANQEAKTFLLNPKSKFLETAINEAINPKKPVATPEVKKIQEHRSGPSLFSPSVKVKSDEMKESPSQARRGKMTDEDAFKLLEKDESDEKKSAKVINFKIANSAILEIVKALYESANDPAVGEVGKPVKTLINKCFDQSEYVVSPKAFLYPDKESRDAAIHKQGPDFDMSCVEEDLYFKDICLWLILKVQEMAVHKPMVFKNLNESTLAWLVRINPKGAIEGRQTQLETQYRSKLNKLVIERAELRNNRARAEINALIAPVIQSMVMEQTTTEAWMEALGWKDKSSNARETEITTFCGKIIKFDKEDECRIVDGVGARELSDTIEEFLKWKDDQSGAVSPIMKEFSKRLNQGIANKRSELDNGDYVSEQVRAEFEGTDLRKVNEEIQKNLIELSTVIHHSKEVIYGFINLLWDVKLENPEQEKIWRSVLRGANLTSHYFKSKRDNASIFSDIDYINQAIKSIFKNKNGTCSVAIEIFKNLMMAKFSTFKYKSELQYGGSPPQLAFKSPRDHLNPSLGLANNREHIDSKEVLEEEKQIDSTGTQQQQILLNENDMFEKYDETDESFDRHERIIGIEHSALEVLNMFKRLRALLHAQGKGTAGYDLVLTSAKSGAKDLVAIAQKASVVNGKHYPVILRQGEKTYIWGNSRFKHWNGNDLILMSLNDKTLSNEKMKSLENETRPILIKDSMDNIRLWKFNGQKWFATEIKSNGKEIKYDGECHDIKDLFPKEQSYKYKACDLISTEQFFQTLRQAGVNDRSRLTELDSNKMDGLTFPSPGQSQILEGYKIPDKPVNYYKCVYGEITQKKAHLNPCLNKLVENIENQKQKAEDGAKDQEMLSGMKILTGTLWKIGLTRL